MAKRASKTRGERSGEAAGPDRGPVGGGGAGRHLVIVESPTKAKTINKYLGREYKVMASVGHVRDLPSKPPKGVKRESMPVPGVDLEHDFAPSYEVMPAKKKTVGELKSAAKKAREGGGEVWFATDLDREGEAIAWHLAQTLGVDASRARRVVFNAITQSEIRHAFERPRPIEIDKVNAQQARRIVDRIVGYQVSPLLWKKVAGGLSAGRVQSVAVRLVVEREREIEAFIPEEYWKLAGYFTVDLADAGRLSEEWAAFCRSPRAVEADSEAGGEEPEGEPRTGKDAARSLRERLAWLAGHRSFRAELVEIEGRSIDQKLEGKQITTLRDRESALRIAQRLGFELEQAREWEEPKAKGMARFRAELVGGPMRSTAARPGAEPPAPGPTPGPAPGPGLVEFRVRSIETKRTTSRPYAPFITSTMQQAAAYQLGFGLQRTMRIAQQLYEGIDVGGSEGQTGLITYMRTDSTHLSPEAIAMARGYIEHEPGWGPKYLPEKPNYFTSSNKMAQEAHEAIRPTDVRLTPKRVQRYLSEEQYKLYRLIWERFLACQMAPAQWDATVVLIDASSPADGSGIATFRATGRTLVFEGFYKAVGVPSGSAGGDDAALPVMDQGQPLAPLQLDPTQHFTSPPPRYSEASLQKKLEEEGIGRPSTYAAIIQTIQDREYVRQLSPRDRRMMATDLGKVVTDKLIEAFPEIMDVGYTREMEAELDKIEEAHHDWVTMLRAFYGPFKKRLEQAHESMTHAKAEMEPAPFRCEVCGAPTVYRFGKKGRFLSCSRYPDCKYAAPIDADGQPKRDEHTDVACPTCGSAMVRRDGRFGPYLSCSRYPECKGIVNLDRKKGTVKAPKPPPLTTDLPCPKCAAPLNLRASARGPWLSCSKYPKCRGRLGWNTLPDEKKQQLELALKQHQHDHPVPTLRTVEGREIADGYVPSVSIEARPGEREG